MKIRTVLTGCLVLVSLGLLARVVWSLKRELGVESYLQQEVAPAPRPARTSSSSDGWSASRVSRT